MLWIALLETKNICKKTIFGIFLTLFSSEHTNVCPLNSHPQTLYLVFPIHLFSIENDSLSCQCKNIRIFMYFCPR